jgi:hypothetical protein
VVKYYLLRPQTISVLLERLLLSLELVRGIGHVADQTVEQRLIVAPQRVAQIPVVLIVEQPLTATILAVQHKLQEHFAQQV